MGFNSAFKGLILFFNYATAQRPSTFRCSQHSLDVRCGKEE